MSISFHLCFLFFFFLINYDFLNEISDCEFWGDFVKTGYFVNNHLSSNLKTLCKYITYVIVVIYRTPRSVLFNRFSVEYKFHSKFVLPFLSIYLFIFITIKSHSVTERQISQESASKKSKKCKAIGSNNYFTLLENNFRSLRTWSIIRVKVHYGL